MAGFPQQSYHVSLLMQVQADMASKPASQCCLEFTQLIDNYSTKELHCVFKAIVDNIYGGNKGLGWNPHLLNSRDNYADYTAIHNFLSPSGPMMRMVYKLQAENLSYPFSLHRLPALLRRVLIEGRFPDDSTLYTNKLQFSNKGYVNNCIFLNSFEYYIFSFALYLTIPKVPVHQQHTTTINNLYTALVGSYLDHFLPTTGSPPGPFPICSLTSSPPSARSVSFLHSFISSNAFTSLLKRPSGHQTPAVQDPAAHQIWHSELFLQVLVDMWLQHSSADVYQKILSPLSLEQSLPSEEHVRTVRLLVKHLHCFAGNLRELPASGTSSAYHGHSASPFDNFKRTAIPRVLQKRLYLFLLHCFNQWPLDCSFRPVFETWLSYIQPWRYAKNTSQCSDQNDCSISDKWVVFVQENLLFYTKFFRMFVSRAVRTNLSSPKHALVLYRVGKVYSPAKLKEMIIKCEQVLEERELLLSSSSPSGIYTSPECRKLNPVSPQRPAAADMVTKLRSHVSSLDGSSQAYEPMFGAENRAVVLQLVQLLQQAQSSISPDWKANRNSERSNNSFLSLLSWGWVGPNGYASDGDDFEAKDSRKLGEHLQKSINYFSQMYKINAALVVPRVVNFGSGSTNNEPDCFPSEHGAMLTPLGRYQLMNGLRRFNIKYKGDLDLQPIRSFENATLVRALHRFSSTINSRCGDMMRTLCTQPGTLGNLSRFYLCRTPPATGVSTHSDSTQLGLQPDLPHPRLCLRFLANYRNILLLLLLYLLLYFMFSFGPISFMLLVMAMTLLYGVVQSTLGDSDHLHQH
uniref:Sphingomyelin phosphodiesterase 4 n=1 Tax=Eptatretus burgeri TaxID=7764 RepID=A0A8C4QAK1_EPTBU